MPIVSIRHLTTYRYRNPVGFGEHRMMLRPMDTHDQRVLSAEVDISPEPVLRRQVFDLTGASTGVVRFATRADRLSFESRVRVDHRPELMQDPDDDDVIGQAGFLYDPHDETELARAMVRQQADGGEVEAWARSFVRPLGATRLLLLLSEMSRAIRADFTYALRLDGPPQTAAATLATRQGSCRDFAVMMIEAVRSLGLAARFVSGYVYSSSPKSGRTGGGHTHAWVRVYLPRCGWVDFDPTNGLVGPADLIRVTSAIDPYHALPLYGAWSGLASDFLGMDVDVDIAVETCAAAQPQPAAQVARMA